MKIFFIGNVLFSYCALQKLIECKANIVGIATKETSSFNADHMDLTPLCIQNQIPYKFVNDINHPKNIEFIKHFEPDVIYCFGWSNILGEEVLKLAPLGVIGFHPAALPNNRGRHPIVWALALGLEKTASTFFFMDGKADTGDIISQKPIAISIDDDAKSLYDKIIKAALGQIGEFTPMLENKTIKRIPQNQSQGNFWRKRSRMDGKIDFRMNSKTIYNLVRSLAKPYVGAHTEIDGKDTKIWEVSIDYCENANFEPGKVLSAENNYIDISAFIDAKIDIMQIYESELGEHPVPRSIENITALAHFRGASVGVKYAEAFQLLKFIDK